MSPDLECVNCPAVIDPAVDTHYRVGEEERPVMHLEKAERELETDDFFARGWVLCASCAATVIPDLDADADVQGETDER